MSYAVKAYMQRKVDTITGEVSIAEAAKAMTDSESGYFGYLIILKDGKPVGIVTERDLVTKVLATGIDPSTTKVSEIMSAPLATIDPDEDMLKASELMRERKIKKLPVVRDGIIYGIISSDDIAQKCGAYVDKSIKDIIRWTAPLGI